MKGTGYDFAFQFLGLADFGGVIAVDGHELEGTEELATQLIGVPAGGNGRIARGAMEPINGIVEGLKHGRLLGGRSLEEAFPK